MGQFYFYFIIGSMVLVRKLTNPWLKDGCTWDMHRGGRGIHSRTNYILGTDSLLLQNVAIQDVRHNTDHYLVFWCLLGANTVAH